MKILIACEFSGIVRDAFANKGNYVISCDLLSTEKPGPHYKGDVLEILNDGWDMIIGHPPCTYLCVPGAHYLHKNPDRWNKMLKSREFFMNLFDSKINRICIENPLPHRYAKLPKYSQIIQPWQFGHELSKRTCLWLKNLPILKPTKIMKNHGERYLRTNKQINDGRGKWSNSKWYATSNAKERSKTFQGIANAMADQWSGNNLKKYQRNFLI